MGMYGLRGRTVSRAAAALALAAALVYPLALPLHAYASRPLAAERQLAADLAILCHAASSPPQTTDESPDDPSSPDGRIACPICKASGGCELVILGSRNALAAAAYGQRPVLADQAGPPLASLRLAPRSRAPPLA